MPASFRKLFLQILAVFRHLLLFLSDFVDLLDMFMSLVIHPNVFLR